MSLGFQATQQSPGTLLWRIRKHAPWVSCRCPDFPFFFLLWTILPNQDYTYLQFCHCKESEVKKQKMVVVSGQTQDSGALESPCYSPSLLFQVVATPDYVLPAGETCQSLFSGPFPPPPLTSTPSHLWYLCQGDYQGLPYRTQGHITLISVPQSASLMPLGIRHISDPKLSNGLG